VYYLPPNYYNAAGYNSTTYGLVYYDGYGYNFYYKTYGYYEYSINEEPNFFVMVGIDILWTIIVGFVCFIVEFLRELFCCEECKRGKEKDD
jgi:hypothetical protein